MGLELRIVWLAWSFFFGGWWGQVAITAYSRWRAREPIFSFSFRKLEHTSVASHCFSCRTKLKIRDVVPVLSFIQLKGKCRYCGASIGLSTLLAELALAVLAAGICYLVVF